MDKIFNAVPLLNPNVFLILLKRKPKIERYRKIHFESFLTCKTDYIISESELFLKL